MTFRTRQQSLRRKFGLALSCAFAVWKRESGIKANYWPVWPSWVVPFLSPAALVCASLVWASVRTLTWGSLAASPWWLFLGLVSWSLRCRRLETCSQLASLGFLGLRRATPEKHSNTECDYVVGLRKSKDQMVKSWKALVILSVPYNFRFTTKMGQNHAFQDNFSKIIQNINTICKLISLNSIFGPKINITFIFYLFWPPNIIPYPRLV